VICCSTDGVKNSNDDEGDANNEERVFRDILSGLLSPEPFEPDKHCRTCFDGDLNIQAERRLRNNDITRILTFKGSYANRSASEMCNFLELNFLRYCN
jgi:hypothetical protein